MRIIKIEKKKKEEDKNHNNDMTMRYRKGAMAYGMAGWYPEKI